MSDEQRIDQTPAQVPEKGAPSVEQPAQEPGREAATHVQVEPISKGTVEAVPTEEPAAESAPEVKVKKATAAPKPKPAAQAAETAATGDDTPAKPKPAQKAAVAEGAADKAAPAKKVAPPPDPRVEAAKALAEQLKQAVTAELTADAVVEAGNAHFQPMLLIRKQDWPRVVDLLRTHPEYKLNYLECMAGTDYKDYIEITVYVQSTELGHFVCLKTRTDREPAEVPSLVSVHPGVNWEEREIYDLLGVHFTGHPDLRRIMMWDEFKGHPLRKDYSEWD